MHPRPQHWARRPEVVEHIRGASGDPGTVAVLADRTTRSQCESPELQFQRFSSADCSDYARMQGMLYYDVAIWSGQCPHFRPCRTVGRINNTGLTDFVPATFPDPSPGSTNGVCAASQRCAASVRT